MGDAILSIRRLAPRHQAPSRSPSATTPRWRSPHSLLGHGLPQRTGCSAGLKSSAVQLRQRRACAQSDRAEQASSSTHSPGPVLDEPQPSPSAPSASSSDAGNSSDVGSLFRLASVTTLGGLSLLGSGFSLDGPWSTVQAASVLALIIFVHECGHFFAARLQGIRVTKFAVGFGPSLFSYKGRDVEYSLRVVPLGGYVAFPDDDPNNKDINPDDPDLLKNRPIPQRGLVISAGVLANLATAYLVLLAQVATVGKPELSYLPGAKVPEVLAGSAAQAAGVRNGDVILRVGGMDVGSTPTQVKDVVGAIKNSPGRRVVLTVQRGPDVLEVPVTPDVAADGGGKIGVQLASNYAIQRVKPAGPAEVLTMTGDEFGRLWGQVYGGLKQLVTNFSNMAGQLSGPVAIVAAGSKIAQTDASGLVQFAAVLNINLAIVNMLPLPGLDGAYLLLLAVEALRGGQKLPRNVELGVMNGGFLLLMAVGIGLVVRDTMNLL